MSPGCGCLQPAQSGVCNRAAPAGPSQPYAVALSVVLHFLGGRGSWRHPISSQRLPREEGLYTSPSYPPSTAGWILIDRCGKHFGTILNYLRDGAVPLPESRREIEELLAEAKYYLVQGLVEECQAALQNKDTYEPFCKVPVITSSKEEQKLIATSNKPAVKLLYNRSNNKYSYTSNSDDNMLKNIELFDKLSLRFNGRVLFIKDVIGDEICCWSFYGQGRKIAEVCCTSIVYATEKKQTKVEFPEARIYEETLNILLYEAQDGRGPDNALLEATGGAAGRSHHLDEDEERERERIERVRRIHVKRPDDRAHLHQ
ncbi:BTB/POZ domain-containing adapter for CUL3-mediated RhoA degradation protein 3 isoform X4 [Pteropus vampyrus]|uniref:BTB/POZ domain-containing adapter for CUL3-mediated RhoA degradation protein 3 isoform X4 n=1 Tax=Pteropus vampyrus TaxID=132908 RepID=A0A6P6BRF2_PTEVA|nr:BTB/POZ domain-containing adapter for CUL3-mediated RhoA degradation protein 3 isoform X4 [Pteropus vampyrus]